MNKQAIYALLPIKQHYRFHVYNEEENYVFDFYMNNVFHNTQQFAIECIFIDSKHIKSIIRSFGLNKRQTTSQKFYEKKVRRCLRVNGTGDISRIQHRINVIFNAIMTEYIKPILFEWSQSDRYRSYISVFGV